MNWQEPKTDWTHNDDYNFEDMNRVENNTEIVAYLISLLDHIPPLEIKKNRNMKSIDFADDYNRIKSNIETLGERYKPVGFKQMKTIWEANDAFSYVDANRYEFNLKLLYLYYLGNTSRQYCGITVCGEEVI